MSSRVVRASKFRHVFGEPSKGDFHFTDLDLATATGDHNYISANEKFFAVAVRGGGGPVLVRSWEQYGKVPRGVATLCGHSSHVLDTAWNTFNSHMLYTASDDGTVGVWNVPEDGVSEKMTEPLAKLRGHGKTVTLLCPHNTAANVLASAGKDHTVRIWDVEKTDDKLMLEGFGGFVQHLAWSPDGAQLATSCKDKKTRLHDVRASTVTAEWQAHDGAKASKVLYLPSFDKLLTVGFTRQSKRQFKGWDPRKLDEPLYTCDIDQSAGVLMPFYDDDTKVLYLAGKGDGNIRYYEMVDEAVGYYALGEFRSSQSAKGMTMLPKRAVNVAGCEVAKFAKLTTKHVETISFTVPRRSESFQEDLYPDTVAAEPAVGADAWFAGENGNMKRVSMDPAVNPDVAAAAKASFNLSPVKKAPAPAPAPAAAGAAAASGDAAALQKKLDAALARVAELEKENEKLKAELAK